MPAPFRAPTTASHMQGKLAARPDPSSESRLARDRLKHGLQPLGSTKSRDGLLYVPETYQHEDGKPAPLITMLHGASGNAKGGMAYMIDLADAVCPSADTARHVVPFGKF